MTGADDQGFIERIAAGDRPALEDLYRQHRAALSDYVRLFTDDSGLIDEIVQDTFMGAWAGARSFEGRSSVRSWLFAIARRKAIDSQRRRTIHVVDESALTDIADPDPGPETRAVGRAISAEIVKAIGELTPAHREALVLTFVHGLTQQELSDVLDVPVGTVKSRLSYAKRSLRAMLEGESGEECL